MRPKLQIDLDEIDLMLLDIVSHVRRFGVSNGGLQRLITERLQTAFDIADEMNDDLAALMAWKPDHPVN